MEIPLIPTYRVYRLYDIAGDLHAVAHKIESISQKLLFISNGDILMTVYNNNYIYYSKRNFQKYLCMNPTLSCTTVYNNHLSYLPHDHVQ